MDNPSKTLSPCGTYFRFAFSSDWNTLHPWTLDKKPVPYVGKRTEKRTTVWALGPLALIVIKV